MKTFSKTGLLAFTMVLSACASLNTIERRTTTPGKVVEVKTSSGKAKEIVQPGKAIHLGIQQRLVIFDALGNYCAEPSPDGLAAFAAAMGISASNPASAAGAASGSGGSSAASIGLRTQSITLMRDSMYRICEASANGQIDPVTVTTLLRRSQDLTAVVLAVEQLTGPIAAQQASLHQSSDATASASLVAVGEQLELATAQVERARERLEAVSSRKAKVDVELGQVDDEITSIQGKLDAKSPAPTPTEIVQLNTQMKTATNKQQKLTSEQASLTESIRLRTTTLEKTENAYELVSQKQDTAFASASSGTTGSGAFGRPTATTELSKEASIAVSGAVKDMVLAVLEQDYMTESCVSLIGVNAAGAPPLKQMCIDLIKAEIEARRAKSELEKAEDERDAAILQANTFAILPRASMEAVMACVTTDSKLDPDKVDLLISQVVPPMDAQDIADIKSEDNLDDLRGELALFPELFNPLATAAKNSNVCI